MSFIIKFIPEAEESFAELVTQLQDRWGDRFVKKFETRVIRCLDTISKTPYIHQITDEMTDLRKCIIHKNCSMFYTVDGDVISIVCFWDNRQDPFII